MNSTHLAIVVLVILTVLAAVALVPEGLGPIGGSPVGVVLTPGPTVEINPSQAEHDLLAQAYRAKLENPEYQAMKSAQGLPKQFQSFAEELEIKQLRSHLAESLETPSGVKPTRIPRLPNVPPAIDGRFGENEWKDALQVAIGVNGATTTLSLLADRDHLYLACDAPQETTEQGYDQFRFYLHLDTTPLLVNERIHVGRRAGKLGGIRQTRVRWQGDAPVAANERWKTYDISDWQIYQHARGASSIDGHRRYEAVLQLAEVGLHHGVPFPAWADVETDPAKKENGKSGGRRYLGQLGAQTAPVWFVLE